MAKSHRNLRSLFVSATDLATASLGDVAQGIGRVFRTLVFYRSGGRRVTPDAARALVAYLRDRAAAFRNAADDLERAIQEEDDG